MSQEREKTPWPYVVGIALFIVVFASSGYIIREYFYAHDEKVEASEQVKSNAVAQSSAQVQSLDQLGGQHNQGMVIAGWVQLPKDSSHPRATSPGYVFAFCDTSNGVMVYAGNSYSSNGGVSVSAVPNSCPKKK
ncbi:MAG: hypothetical protein V4690_02350 [Patescibacteria group bacterium]